MSKELLISREGSETWSALFEDGRPVELRVEYQNDRSLLGNIYKGRVENVLSGMDVAFVDIGTARNGFLYVGEVDKSGVDSRLPGRSAAKKRISELLKAGEEVLVQVTRDALGTKGPRLTMHVGLPGRLLVYLPFGQGVGASKRLAPAERERLRLLCQEILPAQGGVVARTAAQGADREALMCDLSFLERVWEQVQRRAQDLAAPALVYAEADLAVRAVRELPDPKHTRILVDDPGLHQRLLNYLQKVAPATVSKLSLFAEEGGLFAHYQLEKVIKEALMARVDLPSGGYLVIDHTEAMTVVDVNSGSYVGRKGLEETSLKINLEACRELARQLRLRDIGGLIVVDFIDLTSYANRQALVAALEAELARDSSKAYVADVSRLGLIQITRESGTWGLGESLTVTCPHCAGRGRVPGIRAAQFAARRRIRALARRKGVGAVPGCEWERVDAPEASLHVEVHPCVAGFLLKERTWLDELAAQTGCRVFIHEASGEVSLDYVAVVAPGSSQ